MFKPSKLCVALLASALLSAPALSQTIKVNGKSISPLLYDSFMNEQKNTGVPETPELKNAIREELIRRELLMQEAQKKKIDQSADILGRIELAKQAVIIQAFLTDYVKTHPITEKKLKANYKKFNQALGKTEYKALHILVEDQAKAQNVIEQLKKGEKFADLAKKYSLDPGSKEMGGALGWSPASNYVPSFADALGKLKKGTYTQKPVQSDFGYHVIFLEDTRPLTPPDFERVKPELEMRAQQEMVDELIKDLRAKAKVE